MKTSEIIEVLRLCAKEEGCTGCPHEGQHGDDCLRNTMKAAADRLEKLDRRAEPENKAMEQLKVENAQLRAVTQQSSETDKIIKTLRCHGAGCDGCGYEHNCHENGCALMQLATDELERLEVKSLWILNGTTTKR